MCYNILKLTHHRVVEKTNPNFAQQRFSLMYTDINDAIMVSLYKAAFIVLIIRNDVFGLAFTPVWSKIRVLNHGLQPYATALFAKSGTKKKKSKGNNITENKLAYRNYEIMETLEAGISLKGTEVKSIRDGKMNIRDGYCKVTKTGQCTLHNVHIGKHSQSGAYFQHEERRIRSLLIHKAEARKFAMRTETPGITLVPLKAYFSDQNKVKFLIGLARGKNVRDKRQDIKDREEKRDIGRMMKNFRV